MARKLKFSTRYGSGGKTPYQCRPLDQQPAASWRPPLATSATPIGGRATGECYRTYPTRKDGTPCTFIGDDGKERRLIITVRRIEVSCPMGQFTIIVRVNGQPHTVRGTLPSGRKVKYRETDLQSWLAAVVGQDAAAQAISAAL